MLVCPLSVPKIVLELTLINLPVRPSKLTPTILNIVKILTLKLISLCSLPFSIALPFPFHKLSNINTPIYPFISTQSVKLSIFKLTNIGISIYQPLHTFTMFQSFSDFSLIIETLLSFYDRRSCLLSSHEISNILSIFLINMLAVSIRLSTSPLSIITHESIR